MNAVEARREGIDLGWRIRARREAMRWTQEELARRAGVGRSWLSLVEQGARDKPSAMYVLRVAQALGTTPRYLLTGVPDDAPRIAQEFTATIDATIAMLRAGLEDTLAHLERLKAFAVPAPGSEASSRN